MAEKALKGGEAWKRFQRLISALNGDVACIDKPSKFENARLKETEFSSRCGYIAEINECKTGESVISLEPGRCK